MTKDIISPTDTPESKLTGLVAGTTHNNKGADLLSQDEYNKASGKYGPWYRGETVSKAPKEAAMTPVESVKDFVLAGWIPETPMIDKTTKITAFGSCFAENISGWLGRRNYRVSSKDENAQKAHVVKIGEGMVNSFVIRQQFEWAWENKVFEEPLWFGYKAEEFGYDDEVQSQTRALFDQTDVFILTFGLSEVWHDEVTGNVFWRTIPKDVYDPTRHKFRVSTVEENRDNIDAIYKLIRKHRPDAKIILTLSPIPLIATFRDTSCITANSVSKSILRVAVDEVLRDHKDEGYLFYWPSYEIVMDVFSAPFKTDRRHLPRPVLDFIMMQFEEVWCVDEGDRFPLDEAWISALAVSGKLPARLHRVMQSRRVEVLKSFASRDSLHPDPDVNAGLAALLENTSRAWDMQDAAAADPAD